MPPKGKRFPGESDEIHPEPFTEIPPQPKEKKEGQLTEKQLKHFFEEGYVVVEKFFTPEELQPCRDAIDVMVENLANKLFAAGKIKEKYEDYGFFKRLCKMEEEFKGSNVLLFKSQKMPEAFQKLWSNPRLLNIIEQLIGPDIAGHPVWNLRTKTPNSVATDIPWHQDSAYFSNESYDHMIPTAWIPFLDATTENGCMQVVKKAHQKGKVARHTCCKGPSWYIMLDEEEMENELGAQMYRDVVTLPIEYGGFLLFHNLTPHRSLQNVSTDVRWSVDLRYQSPKENWGFYGIGEGVVMRSSTENITKPDFFKFLNTDRKEIWQKRYFKQVNESDPFDTTMVGPWMGQWELINHNRHTTNFKSYDYSNGAKNDGAKTGREN